MKRILPLKQTAIGGIIGSKSVFTYEKHTLKRL